MKKTLVLVAIFLTLASLSPVMAQHRKPADRAEYKSDRFDNHPNRNEGFRHWREGDRVDRQCVRGRQHDGDRYDRREGFHEGRKNYRDARVADRDERVRKYDRFDNNRGRNENHSGAHQNHADRKK